jgi:hypothetical protein
MLANARCRELQILRGHVLEEVYHSEDFVDRNKYQTLNGDLIKTDVRKGTVKFNAPNRGTTGRFVMRNIEACGGVVHIIDKVLVAGPGESDGEPSTGTYGEAPEEVDGIYGESDKSDYNGVYGDDSDEEGTYGAVDDEYDDYTDAGAPTSGEMEEELNMSCPSIIDVVKATPQLASLGKAIEVRS